MYCSVLCVFLSFIILCKVQKKNRILKSKSKENMVIVFSKGYPVNNLNPFFRSLKRQSPESYLLIFSDNETISYANKVYNNNEKVIGIEFLQNYPFYPSNHYKFPISKQFLTQNIPTSIDGKFNFFYHTIRFFLINVWLKKYGDLYSSFLLCDIKDIIFQSNPFTYYKKSGLYFQQEINIRYGKKGIIADIYNYNWIKPYNPTKDMLLKPILNCGQILGNSKEMKRFISEFCVLLSKTHINTAEQATFNYFIYSNKYKGKYISKAHGYGFALLLHFPLPRTQDDFTPINNYLYNFDKTIPPIVHAYHIGLNTGSINRRRKYREFVDFHNKP